CLFHRTFDIPANAGAIQFQAALYRPAGAEANGLLEVRLEGVGREMLPLEVRVGEKWQAAKAVAGPEGEKIREYRWPVDQHPGKRVRIAVIDTDNRAGCYIISTGFRIVTRNEMNARQFVAEMTELRARHRLPRIVRYDSKHFMALSNANSV